MGIPTRRLLPESPVRERARAREEMLFFLRRLSQVGVVIVLLLTAGTVGLALVEHVSPWRAFVWSLDTVATVGSIPTPTDTGGQVITVVLIVFGVGTLFYALVTATEVFVAGHLSGLLEERRVQKRADALADHHILCGFGRVGRQVARDLTAAGERYVIVDERPENRERLEDARVPFIVASASDDDALRAAGVERARAVLACVDSDAENVFITLTARQLNPDITVIARASAEDSEQKLRRAGADRVISPYKASGHAMARLALHPQVTGVVEVPPAYRMEEIEISPGCAAAGRRLDAVLGDAFAVGIRLARGTFEFQPPGDTTLEPGDVVLVVGRVETMERLERLSQPPGAPPTASPAEVARRGRGGPAAPGDGPP